MPELEQRMRTYAKAGRDFARHTLEEDPEQDVMELVDLIIEVLVEAANGDVP